MIYTYTFLYIHTTPSFIYILHPPLCTHYTFNYIHFTPSFIYTLHITFYTCHTFHDIYSTPSFYTYYTFLYTHYTFLSIHTTFLSINNTHSFLNYPFISTKHISLSLIYTSILNYNIILSGVQLKSP
jgi:hypothetical protein